MLGSSGCACCQKMVACQGPPTSIHQIISLEVPPNKDRMILTKGSWKVEVYFVSHCGSSGFSFRGFGGWRRNLSVESLEL